MKKIAVLTGTRAEYGLLKPMLEWIEKDEELELCLIATGAHLEAQFGETRREILQDGFCIHYEVPMELKSDQPDGILKSMALEINGLADIFAEEQFDLLVLLGDRYEILIAAVCALLNRVPIAHIHGGELTQGAVDDSIRHAVTKMSAIHFTSTERYRKRIIQMGENPDSVYNVGAPGVENIHRMQYLSREQLTEKFGIQWDRPLVMATYHPITLEQSAVEEQMEHLLYVFKRHPEYNYVFTYANADVDGQKINRMIEEFARQNENCLAFASMGREGYLNMLRYASAVVGNSSSGIIEAPSFHIPTVNIGSRQTGRVKAETVVDCGIDREEIERAFQRVASEEFRQRCRSAANPYEGVDTARTIVQKMKEYLKEYKNTKKKFWDWKEEME